MTKIKFTVSLSNNADLIITDTTGFFDATLNPEGYNPPGQLDANQYGLDQGYFFNAVLYNGYNVEPTWLNIDEVLYTPTTVNATYALNFSKMEYKLAQDGVFTVKRFFIISEALYNLNLAYYQTQPVVYYSNGTGIFKSTSGAAGVSILKSAFILEATEFVAVGGMVTSVKFVSTFFLSQCYFTLLNRLVDEQIVPFRPCDIDQALIISRDILYMTLEVIKNHKKLGNVVQIQKIIETLNACGSICKGILPVDCGCHG